VALAYVVLLGWRFHKWRGALLTLVCASLPASIMVYALAATLAHIDRYAAVRVLLAVGILVAGALVLSSAWHLIRPYLLSESRARLIVIAAVAVALVIVGATPVRVLLVAAVISAALPVRRAEP
jgi:chromate transport protein ChrA